MRNRGKYIGFLIIVIFIAITSSCIKNESCLPANNLLTSQIYTVDDQSEIVEYKIDSMSLYIMGRPDTLYNNVEKVGQFTIPLSDSSNHLTILLNLNDKQDTIWIDYIPFSVFRSTSCGIINRYEITNLNYTKNGIWYLYNQNNLIDENKGVNFYFFYRTI